MRALARWIPVVLLVGLVVFPDAANAQRRRDDAPDRAQIEQRIRAQMGRMMQERLGLDEAKAARLSEVVQTFETRRRELAVREQATRRRVEALVQTDDASDQAALELVRLQAALRMEEAQLFRAEQDALLAVLTPRQLLTLQDLREDLGRRIRALRGGARDGNSSGPPRGPGPRQDGRIGGQPVPEDRSPPS
jgi:Spy/CpxP family protein refolding chaperone